MATDVPISLQSGNTLKGVSVWGQVILTILALSSIVSYGWIAVMDVQTAADVEAVQVYVDERVDSLEGSISTLQDDVRDTNLVVQCILWEVPPEQCAAPRRVP